MGGPSRSGAGSRRRYRRADGVHRPPDDALVGLHDVGRSAGQQGRVSAEVYGKLREAKEAGFVAGTAAVPRVAHVVAGPGYTFTPSSVAVARGETVTFVVTAMGPAVHEFMVGPVGAVAADAPGAPEIAVLSMMQSKSLTYTFDGSGPYAFACHAEGHYQAGMHGTIAFVG